MLKQTREAFAIFENEPDGEGGEWVTLTPENLKILLVEIDRFIGRKNLAWLAHGGLNAFDAPTKDDQALVAKALFLGAKKLPFGIHRYYQPLANAYMQAMWFARQEGIIEADEWGACFMAGWISQDGSLHSSIDLSQAETAAMFEAMGDAGSFYWNKSIKCRAELPEEIRLYRGIAGSAKPNAFSGYSWTDSAGTGLLYAVHRADQIKKSPMIIAGTFKRDDVATVYEHRSGSEAAEDDYCEWLIKPGAMPTDVEVFAVSFNVFKCKHELQRVT